MSETVSKRQRNRKLLPSYAIDNAKERLAAFHAANAAVIDEYLQLKEEVRLAAAEVGKLEAQLRGLLHKLTEVYEEKS